MRTMFCYNIKRTFALVILYFSNFMALSAQKFEIHQVYMSNGGGEVRTIKIKAADKFSLKKNVCSWVEYEELSDRVQLIATRNTSKNSRSCKIFLLDDSGFSTDTLEIIQTGRLSGTVSKVAGASTIVSGGAAVAKKKSSTSNKSTGGQCAARTKKGTRCSRRASAGSPYCWQHNK